MASVLFLLGFGVYTTVKKIKEKKQHRQQQNKDIFTDNPSYDPPEKPTKMGHGHHQSKEPHESLREKIMKKVHGKDANPSQLGDPVSIKAETSDTVPTDDESGSTTLRGSEESSRGGGGDGRAAGAGSRAGGRGGQGRRLTRRERAVGGNPSMLGDPISVKAETEDRGVNAEEEEASLSTAKSKL